MTQSAWSRAARHNAEERRCPTCHRGSALTHRIAARVIRYPDGLPLILPPALICRWCNHIEPFHHVEQQP